MNTLQCVLFGIGWLFAALIMGLLIRRGLRGERENTRKGLILILVSFACGIAMLGMIISSMN